MNKTKQKQLENDGEKQNGVIKGKKKRKRKGKEKGGGAGRRGRVVERQLVSDERVVVYEARDIYMEKWRLEFPWG